MMDSQTVAEKIAKAFHEAAKRTKIILHDERNNAYDWTSQVLSITEEASSERQVTTYWLKNGYAVSIEETKPKGIED